MSTLEIRSAKVVKAPTDLPEAPYHQGILKMNGLSVIESCTHTHSSSGTMFLEDHLLLFVLEGRYTIRFGNESWTVRKNEMVLLQKSIVVEYEKTGEPGTEYLLDYMMFFLKEDVLGEFIKLAELKAAAAPAAIVPISVNPVNHRLVSYIQSLKPYFLEPEKIGGNLIRVKLLELLFDVADTDENFLYQFLQLKHKERKSITQIVEENLMNPVSLSDLAYLSGRSLATFKRDFHAAYNMSPLQWIRSRRLDKARELLENSPLSVTEVCFSTGFENVAHFSRVFKERFGYPPSAAKSVQKHT